MTQANIVFLSPGILRDGGGIEIVIGSDGKVHVIHVPPNNPLLQEVGAAVSILEQAARMTDKAAAQQFQAFAEGVIQARGKELQQQFGQAGRVAASH
jgi:hypothetical protein